MVGARDLGKPNGLLVYQEIRGLRGSFPGVTSKNCEGLQAALERNWSRPSRGARAVPGFRSCDAFRVCIAVGTETSADSFPSTAVGRLASLLTSEAGPSAVWAALPVLYVEFLVLYGYLPQHQQPNRHGMAVAGSEAVR